MLGKERPKPEQGEIITAKTKKPEVSATKVDVLYHDEVARYFYDENETLKGDISEEHEDVRNYYNEAQKELSLLTNNDRLDKLRSYPETVSVGMSKLANDMGAFNPDVPNNKIGNPEIDQENERRYFASKKIFMEANKKLYPDANSDINQLPSLVEKLNADDLFSYITIIPSVSDIIKKTDKLRREDPRQLAECIDNIMKESGNMMDYIAFDKIILEKSIENEENTRKSLKNIGEVVYTLQLIRDELRKEMYGNSNVSPADTKKIDDMRDELRGVKKIEKKDTEIINLKEIKSKAGFFRSQLEQKFRESLTTLKWPNIEDSNIDGWKKLSDGLSEIHSEWMKDKDLPTNKRTKYKKQVKDLFDSLR